MVFKIRSLDKVCPLDHVHVLWVQSFVFFNNHVFLNNHRSRTCFLLWRTLLFESSKSLLDESSWSQGIIFSKGLSDVKRSNELVLWQIWAFSYQRNILNLCCIIWCWESKFALFATIQSTRSHWLDIGEIDHIVNSSFRTKSGNFASKFVHVTWTWTLHPLFLKLNIYGFKCFNYFEFLVTCMSPSEGLKLTQEDQLLICLLFLQ